MKWSFAHFDYRGEMMCSMAAFKEHCAFGFRKSSLVVGESENKNEEALGQMGRITDLSDLPSRKGVTAQIRKAMALNDAGIKAPRKKRPPKKPLPVPPALTRALKANKPAREAFDGFSPGARRDYVEWLL